VIAVPAPATSANSMRSNMAVPHHAVASLRTY
jgi:hypothetical protein